MKGSSSLIGEICKLQRHIDMMERLMGDCIIILSKRDPGHFTVDYDEEDVGIGKNLIELCYKTVEDSASI
jgi:hypothetical protein